jgi:hypothetical protein
MGGNMHQHTTPGRSISVSVTGRDVVLKSDGRLAVESPEGFAAIVNLEEGICGPRQVVTPHIVARTTSVRSDYGVAPAKIFRMIPVARLITLWKPSDGLGGTSVERCIIDGRMPTVSA